MIVVQIMEFTIIFEGDAVYASARTPICSRWRFKNIVWIYPAIPIPQKTERIYFLSLSGKNEIRSMKMKEIKNAKIKNFHPNS